MRLRPGPQPGAIRAFAVLFGGSACLSFLAGLSALETTTEEIAAALPGLSVTRDLAIVLLSARLTVAAITLGLVWIVAARFARWMLAAVALVTVIGLAQATIEPTVEGGADILPLVVRLLGLAGILCLFAPGADGWFARKEIDGESSD